MKLDKNLISIHAYLCADGYVIKSKNPKYKYYKIGLRNTNLVLLKDFQEKFEIVFGIKPHLREGERCEIGSKDIYEELTKKFGSFYSWHWKIPQNLNHELIREWLRSYFDCEGWVFCKSHQNRHIGADCINEFGMKQVIESLNNLGIHTIYKINKKRKMHRVFIYGKENLLKFKKEIGFLHPEKSKKLDDSIDDYMEYNWKFPENEKECKIFILNLLKDKIRFRKPHYVRIFSKEENNLKILKKLLNKFYKIESLLYMGVNGIGTVYYELNINKKSEIQKLINLKIIPNILQNV